ncbi:MAG: F0F1 ATP synthase subunit epsilon [Pseudomonadota bacterium]
MADMMQFDLVSPERALASQEASAVQIPGLEGDMTAMPNHAPFMTVLRPGVLTVSGAGGDVAYVVTGGFAEVSPVGVSVLAEQAMPREEAKADDLAELVAETEAALETATEETEKTALAIRVNDLKGLAASL